MKTIRRLLCAALAVCLLAASLPAYAAREHGAVRR